jgi:hypothetical protein
MERLCCLVVALVPLVSACGWAGLVDGDDDSSSALASQADMLIGNWLNDGPGFACGAGFIFGGVDQFRHIRMCDPGLAQVTDGVYDASNGQLTLIPHESSCPFIPGATWSYRVNGDTLTLQNSAGILAFERFPDAPPAQADSSGRLVFGCYDTEDVFTRRELQPL